MLHHLSHVTQGGIHLEWLKLLELQLDAKARLSRELVDAVAELVVHLDEALERVVYNDLMSRGRCWKRG